MIILLRRRHILTAAGLFLAAALAFAVATVPKPAITVAGDTALSAKHTIFLDAGHGGEDGGAVSDDGVAESALNLSITCKAAELLCFLGQDAQLTRPGESAIYDAGCTTLREKKVSDIHNRVDMVNSAENAVLISIHQNKLPGQPQVHGAQVFYNTAAPAQELANTVQAALNGAINTDNAKQCKPIGQDIYLMAHVTHPAILVECGFLSSPTETALLQTPDYQLTVALSIVCGYLQYTTKE